MSDAQGDRSQPPGSGTLSVAQVERLLRALAVLSRTSEHILERRAVLAALGEPLSTSRVRVLRLLGQRGEQTATRVARFLGVTRPAVTQIIDSLAAAGLVERRPAEHDRREVRVQLTPRGRQLFHLVRRRQRQYVRNAARDLGPDAVERWIDTLREIACALAQADRAFKHFCAQCGAYEDGSCVLLGGEADCLFLRYHRVDQEQK